MIPEAAVEAARLAVYRARWVEAFGPRGIVATDEVIASAALEAAAQHISAQALEDAAGDLSLHGNVRDRLRARAAEIRK